MPVFAGSVAVVIPTLNAAKLWTEFHQGLCRQTLAVSAVLVVDSESDDGTEELARAAGYGFSSVSRAEFNHGSTRQSAVVQLSDVDILIFLTQDAILIEPDALEKLVAPFADPGVAATYGRQMPRPGANAREAHARLYNYPADSHVNRWEQRSPLGIKAAFLSNSFSAFRRTALESIGGFRHTILAEDALASGRLLMAGWTTVYVGDAIVKHSHDYSVGEEFSRYFDTGVYHSRAPWLLKNFGSATGEGQRFLASELKYLLKHAPHLIPSALVRTFAKWMGYELGRHEAKLPMSLRRRLSMHKTFWDQQPVGPQF